MQFSRDSTHLLVAGYDLTEWQTYPVASPQPLHKYDDRDAEVARYADDDQRVIAGYGSGAIRIFDRESTTLRHELAGHIDTVAALAVGDASRGLYRDLLLSGGRDGVLRGWDLKGCVTPPAEPCSPLFSLVHIDAKRWLVVAAGSRFDTNSFDDQRAVSWVASDEPLRALPLEIFMRDYFEPGLLSRVMNRESLPAAPSIGSLNRVQPLVKSITVQPQPAAAELATKEQTQRVRVTVRVAGDSRDFDVDGRKVKRSTGVYDVRLFRDGQLIGRNPQQKSIAARPGASVEEERVAWRKEHSVLEVREGEGAWRDVVFENVRLPREAGKSSVEFSAYAFNEDRVKSETARVTYPLPTGLEPRKPRAYIITIGVNTFQDETWNLSYAATDAWEAGTSLEQALGSLRAADGSPEYEHVVRIPLISGSIEQAGVGHTHDTAHKRQIAAVFKTLSGQAVARSQLAGLDSAADLQRVNPEDLVVIVVSTHGMVDSSGTFYFLPTDIGNTFKPSEVSDPAAKAKLLSSVVSSDELVQWLQDLDAARQVMIIDACYSAASVASPEFKPGPLGSRGLGQLAFDKGMQVLAATRADQTAVETDRTGMGLLIYALVEEGLKRRLADSNGDGTLMFAELLDYARNRVPGIYDALGNGTLKGTKGSLVPPTDSAPERDGSQQPTLFDFSRHPDVPVARPGN